MECSKKGHTCKALCKFFLCCHGMGCIFDPKDMHKTGALPCRMRLPHPDPDHATRGRHGKNEIDILQGLQALQGCPLLEHPICRQLYGSAAIRRYNSVNVRSGSNSRIFSLNKVIGSFFGGTTSVIEANLLCETRKCGRREFARFRQR